MRINLALLLVLALLVLLMATPVFAQENQPVGGCPDNFHLHNTMDHTDHEGHSHHHIGNDQDQNGDGFLCVKHVGESGINHVHIDNNVPLN